MKDDGIVVTDTEAPTDVAYRFAVHVPHSGAASETSCNRTTAFVFEESLQKGTLATRVLLEYSKEPF